MKILMVCLGNICRSPMAQGILESKLKEQGLDWEVDSAGTSGWHDGEAPDKRSVKVCRNRNIDISGQICRKITKDDLDYYDVILAMDSSNYQDITQLCTTDIQKSKVRLIMNFKYHNRNIAVPDPYYDDRFSEVFELLDDVTGHLIQHYK
ncbi:MAG: low molecular weight phosphotyrosine protein phosphatase [Saprospiraceae bacterium]|nr:low molecular weight phosphotyrosine protein phosphatase [Saprospiraceae bacterium]